MFKAFKKTGAASMVEIIVTSIIFVTAAVGIIVTTSSFRPKAADASKELAALYQARAFIHNLRMNAGGHTFSNGCTPQPPGSYSQSFSVCNIAYNIIDDDLATNDNPCRMEMRITW